MKKINPPKDSQLTDWRRIRTSLLLYWQAGSRNHPWLMVGTGFAAAVTILAEVGFFLTTAAILNQISAGESSLNAFALYIAAAAGSAILAVAFMVLYSFCDWNLYVRTRPELEKMIIDTSLGLPEQFYAEHFAGGMVADAKKFIAGYKTTNNLVFDHGIQAVVMSMIALIVVSVIFWPAALVLAVLSIAFGFVSLRLRSREVKLAEQMSKADSDISAQMADVIGNISTVLVSGARNSERERFLLFPQIWKQRSQPLIRQRMRNHSVLWAFPKAVYVIALTVGIWMAVSNGASVGAVYLLLIYFAQATNSVSNVEYAIPDWLEAVAEAAPMAELIEKHQHREKNLNSPFSSEKDNYLQLDTPSLEICNLEFSYPGKPPLFSGLNLKVEAGETIGLIGSSGGGKTTISKLLLRLLDPDKGQVKIGDNDISKIQIDNLRQQMSYISQDPVLFHRSIADNIAYGTTNATLEDIEKAAREANADEFIRNLPNGYDAVVGERGMKLSGGQRQRIALARAFLRNSPVLILDEPTSALDSHSEHLIQQALQRLFVDKTVVVIAHRLSTISHLDRIVVIDQGNIVETGTHQQLLNKTHSRYSQLWQYQSEGFIDADA